MGLYYILTENGKILFFIKRLACPKRRRGIETEKLINIEFQQKMTKSFFHKKTGVSEKKKGKRG